MGRGGRRSGVQGRSYSNRSDMASNARPLPIATPMNKPYGVAGQMVESQQAIPLAAAPSPGGPTHTPEGGGAPPGPLPGSLGPFDGPTTRPGEPITAAPESMAPGGDSLAEMLAMLAQDSQDPTLVELAQRAMELGE